MKKFLLKLLCKAGIHFWQRIKEAIDHRVCARCGKLEKL
jgi:hypothetical protein